MYKEKHLVISHKDCSDGLCAAHVAKTVLESKGEEVEVIFFNHKEIELENIKNNAQFIKAIEESHRLTLTDISLPADVMEFVYKINNGLKTKVIDHHISAQRDYEAFLNREEYPLLKRKVENGQYKFEFNNNYSGGVLTYVEMVLNESVSNYKGEYDDKIPKFLRYVQDRDIWKWEFEKESKPFNQTFFYDCKTLKDIEEKFPLKGFNSSVKHQQNIESYINNGCSVLNHIDRQLSEIAKEAQEASVEINGIKYKGYIINNSALFNSDLGNKLSHLNEDHHFTLLWSENSQGIVKCSLRGKNTFDVSVIAKHFNGGGHKAASAFAVEGLDNFAKIKKDFQTDVLKIESDLMPKPINNKNTNQLKY